MKEDSDRFWLLSDLVLVFPLSLFLGLTFQVHPGDVEHAHYFSKELWCWKYYVQYLFLSKESQENHLWYRLRVANVPMQALENPFLPSVS